MSSPTITEPARSIPIAAEVDVLVIGGGPAGVAAAVAAARSGARTCLVERHGFFGGMWTAGMVLTLAGYNSWLRPYSRCVAGVGGEWLEAASEMGGAGNHDGFVINSDPEVMKRAADDLLVDAGVHILLHTLGAFPIVEGDDVVGCFIENVDGRSAVVAAVTIDCSGNGDVFARAGEHFEKSDSLQPMTMPFRLGSATPLASVEHDGPMRIPIGPEPGLLAEPLLSRYASTRADVDVDKPAMRSAAARGELPSFGGPWFGGLEKDIVWVNASRVVGDASDATELTRAEIVGRRESSLIVEYFRENVPSLRDCRLLQTSTQIGVRETRRLVGRYVLTGDDIREARRFDDSIAVGCWPIDVHPVDGVGSHAMFVPLPYDVPYRVLLPGRLGGLLVAGRCASFDREALGSARVGATCAAMGHAAGAAAAIAAAGNVQPADVDITELQTVLRKQHALVEAGDVT